MVSWKMLFCSIYLIISAMFPQVPWRSGTPGVLDKNRFLDSKSNPLNQSSQRACLITCMHNKHPGWFLSSRKWQNYDWRQMEAIFTKYPDVPFCPMCILPIVGWGSTWEVKDVKSWQLHIAVLPSQLKWSVWESIGKYFASEWHNRYVK